MKSPIAILRCISRTYPGDSVVWSVRPSTWYIFQKLARPSTWYIFQELWLNWQRKYLPTYLPVYQTTYLSTFLEERSKRLVPFQKLMRWHDLTKMYFSKLYIYPNCILCTRLTHLLSFTSLFMLKKTNSCWFAIVIWFQGLNSGEFEVLNSGLRFYCKKFNKKVAFTPSPLLTFDVCFWSVMNWY